MYHRDLTHVKKDGHASTTLSSLEKYIRVSNPFLSQSIIDCMYVRLNCTEHKWKYPTLLFETQTLS